MKAHKEVRCRARSGGEEVKERLMVRDTAENKGVRGVQIAGEQGRELWSE